MNPPTEAQHTPGPWHRNIPPASHYPTVFAGRNTHVAQVVSRGLEEREIEANCNLIAAAPSLLSACEAALKLLDGPRIGQDQADLVAALRTAIASARKEQS